MGHAFGPWEFYVFLPEAPSFLKAGEPPGASGGEVLTAWLIPKGEMPEVLFLGVVRLAFGVFPHTGHVLGLDAIAGAATSG